MAYPGRFARAAARGPQRPGRARAGPLMLWLGIGSTIGANIAYGAGYGLVGALISAWAAVAFIGAVEIAMQLVRRARGSQVAETVPDVPGNAEQAVRAAYAASVAAGQPLSQRAMAERFGLSRRKVSQLATCILRRLSPGGVGRVAGCGVRSGRGRSGRRRR